MLDCIVFAYDSIPRPPDLYIAGEINDAYTTAAFGKLEYAKRLFVSEIQEVLNPRHRESQVSKIQDQFAVADSMRRPEDQSTEITSPQ